MKIAYAINKVSITTMTYKLGLVDEDESSASNRWEMYDINYLDLST
jgi:hypothetical protein